MKEKESRRIFRYDLLKAVAITAVIANHSLTRFYHNESEHQIAEYFNIFLRFAVPMFLFVSGVLFKRDCDLRYLGKKFVRVILPYLIFFIPSTFFVFYIKKWNIFDFPMIISGLIFGRGYAYFYVFVILICYLLSYVLLKLFKGKIGYVFFISLFVHLIWMIIDELIYKGFNMYEFKILGFQLNDFIFYRNPFTWFVFFAFGLWYQSGRVQDFIGKYKYFIIFSFWVTYMFYNVMLFCNLGDYSPYGSIIWTIYSFFAILSLTFIKIKNRKVRGMVEFISSISYSLFFIHYFVVYALDELEVMGIGFNYYLALVYFLFNFSLSILLTLGLKYLLGKSSRLLIGG